MLTMNTETRISRTLDEICGHICSVVDNINWGGCGVFALELARAIRKYYGESERYSIHIWSHDEEYLPNVEEVEKEVLASNGGYPSWTDAWNDNGVYFNHIRLWYGESFWDAVDGPVSFEDAMPYEHTYHMLDGSISEPALAVLIENPDNWNPDFNRDQIPAMREFIEETFKKHLTV